MSTTQQSGYYYYRKSTILFFTNNGEKEYDNLIKKQQYLAWLDLPQEQKNIFDSVALFCSKNSINIYDKKTQRVKLLGETVIFSRLNSFYIYFQQPQKPPNPLFLFFRVVEERLRKDNPTLKQSQIFKIAEHRWKNNLIQRIKDQFTKIHQILELAYNHDIMQYKKANKQDGQQNKNNQILQKYSMGQPGLKFSTLTRQSIVYRSKQNYSIISQLIINPASLTTTDSEYTF